MQRKWLNIVTMSIVLLILIIGLHFLLRPLSPRGVTSTIYAIKFFDDTEKLYQIQGHHLICEPTDTPLKVHCKTTFEGQSFEVRVNFHNVQRTRIQSCIAQFTGKTIPCNPSWSYENQAPSVIIPDDLGISMERFAQLRQQTPLLYWPETRWVKIIFGVSGALALAVIIWLWMEFPKNVRIPSPGHRLLLSLYVGILMWFTLFRGGNIIIDYLLPRSVSIVYVVPYLAFLGGVATFMWEWYRLAGRRIQSICARGLHSVGGGVIVGATVSYMLLGNFVLLGFID